VDTPPETATLAITNTERVRAARTATTITAIGFASFFVLVAGSARAGWFSFDVTRLTPLFAGLLLVDLVLLATVRVWATRPWTSWVFFVIHTAALTVIIHHLGGVAMGIMVIGYALGVILFQLLRPDASVFVAANLALVAYAVLAWLEGTDRLPAPAVVAALEPMQYVGFAVTAFLALNLLALYANRYAHQLRRFAVHLQRCVAERTAELATANADLARAYEDLGATQAQLLETEKRSSLALLVAGVAHEINNPVSFIIGNVEPLRSTIETVEQLATARDDPELARAAARIRRITDMITRGAERTAGIVADLRLFSHIGDERLQSVDVNDAIELTLRLLRPRWIDRIVLHRDYGVLSPVEASAGRLNQVLMNVLANACDAIRRHGNVWITTRAEAMQVSIAIRDDGSGIAASDLPHIFDPFFTTKPVGEGTGLGLAISRSIVDDHGGTIAAAVHPSGGAVFTITLPVTSGVRSARRSPTPSRPAPAAMHVREPRTSVRAPGAVSRERA
jgi:signal transduction histidine kinase